MKSLNLGFLLENFFIIVYIFLIMCNDINLLKEKEYKERKKFNIFLKIMLDFFLIYFLMKNFLSSKVLYFTAICVVAICSSINNILFLKKSDISGFIFLLLACIFLFSEIL